MEKEKLQRGYHITIVTIIVLVALFGMYYLRSVFNPFLLAMALAYILNPVINWFERRGLPRKVAIAAMFLFLFVALTTIALVGVPKLYWEAKSWGIEVVGEPFTDNNGNGKFDGEEDTETYTDLNNNGVYDEPEPFTDDNGNGVYDAKSERDTWVDVNKNNRFDEEDTFDDLNGNGEFDASLPADSYEDTNKNGKWDSGEPFVDKNGNGKYDKAIKPDTWDAKTQDLNENGKFDEGYFPKISRRLSSAIAKDGVVRGFIVRFISEDDFDKAISNGLGTVKSYLFSLAGSAGSIVTTAWQGGLKGVGWLWDIGLLIILTPIYLAFLLNSLESGWRKFTKYIPGRIRPRMLDVIGKIDLVVSAFFRGRLLVCSAMGIFTAIGFAIVGVRFGVLFGLLIGLLSFIPFLNILGLVPALLTCWMAEFTLNEYIAVMVVYAVGQALDPLLTSLVLGKDLELHPVTILLSLFVCSALFGFFGMLLAVPLVAALKILAREFLLPSMEALAREESEYIPISEVKAEATES
ncbi:MAG: AI-2E family transporter [Planctomycetes bacterium]|nr:AI-2E family transporter [Planctomycetota bacterium]